MPQQTKTIRVFISSTFTDMGLERSLLQKHVFPKLEKFCLLNHAKFQAVDLRWGVTEETQRNQKTLQTCLNEVARCQRISPKPNFLILLGDKYGWQPIPERVPEKEMDEILQVISDENKKVIFFSETDLEYKGWYRKDENALPSEYVLQPRGKEHEVYSDWQPIENDIREILRKAAEKCNFTEAQRVKYFTSATHQEIINGALKLPADMEEPQKHVFAFVRNTKNLPKNKEGAGFIDLDKDGKQDTDALGQLLQLKEELKETLQDNYIEYDAEWKNKTVELERTFRFLGKVYVRLKNVIKKQLKSIADPDEITHEQRLHYDFKEKLVNHFRGREGILDEIQEYIDGDQTKKVLALIGESGSGKSSVMAKITDELIDKEKENNTVIAYRFLGTSSNSSNVISMMQSVAGQIARAFSVKLSDLTADGDEKGLHEIYGMSEVFKKCLALATPEKPVIVFLDALDQLSDTDNALQLHWLPQELPSNVKLVVSSLPELEGQLSETQKMELPLLPEEEIDEILKTWLGSINRKLTDKQFDEITRKEVSKLPIYLRIAFEQAKHWKSYHNYELSESVDGIIKDFINRLESEHVNGLVEHVICYMLCGRYQGLAENEILDILVFDDEFWEAFLKHTHKDHLNELKAAKKIPVAVWSRLYLDLEPFLTERDADGVPIITFFHRQFNEVLKDYYGLKKNN